MRSFLEAANDDRAKNKVMMTWVRQIRELASDLEDGIELAVHLDMESTWWLRMIPSCIAPTLPLDEAEAEIKELRDRVEELSGRNKRYNIIPDAGSNTTTFLVPLLQPTPDPVSSKRQVGVQDLSRLISNKRRDLQVISVLCTGGDFGMATLIREAYNDPGVCHDFGCRAWVKLVHPFNPHEFIHCLMAQFYANSHSPIHKDQEIIISKEKEDEEIIGVQVLQCMKAPEYNLLGEFVQKMKKKYLVILEDLPTMVVWDAIRALLPDWKNGSRIIVSTHQMEIAELCVGHPYQVAELIKFSVHHSVYAYSKLVSVENKIPPSFSGQEAAELRELILKCGGLPKILVAISGLLTTKTAATWMETASSINDKFMYHLETNPAFAGLQGMFDRMQSTLRDSPDYLKPYIFYLSIFPRDCSIRRRRLVRRWIAEGYSTDSNDRTAEENGEICFSKLLNMGIIHPPRQLVTTAFTDTSMVSCQVDGFYREYIISRRMEENLVCELRDSSSISTKCTGRHLIIRENWNRDPNVFRSMDFRRLRSMTVFGMWDSFFISASMKHFRALDLENASGVSDLDLVYMVRMLPRLKFLSLRGCHQITHLPIKLSSLRQLQTLDVRHTSIVALPPGIIKLQKLQYIRAGATVPAEDSISGWRRPRVGVIVPRTRTTGIRKLVELRTLGVINIGVGVLKELKKLTQLQKLGVCGINRRNSEKFFDAISGHGRLESLSVQLDMYSQRCLDDITMPLDNLHSLKLYGLDDKLPKWSDRLTKLTKLDLEMQTLKKNDMRFFADKDDMRVLGELPKLCVLRLHMKQQQDGKLHFCVIINGDESLSYDNVKILEIVCSSRLHVDFGSKTMKHLELLKVDCRTGSYLQFAGLDNLSELKETFLKGSYDETLKKHLEEELADHPKKHLLKSHEESTC
ncbi:hypothetical protein QYE76_035902 [Lolium multiflorum]|uniref:Uncharacterized protein n=1 Tax=Lolium multiflorum TaxID=4521 RepID=A0AAD8VML8_LOLMU|nr:hypothetical protein QYE76_035902 [Lolium multiflorum]